MGTGRGTSGRKAVCALAACTLLALVSFISLRASGLRRLTGEGAIVQGKTVASEGQRAAAAPGGFETWVLVQNPGEDTVRVDLALDTENGRVNLPELQDLEIPPGT
ncbi:MAG: hypothetical protein HPY75_14415, partial [Actinobacteria bacterium]|nr:hypothetical protein [Actinomycetota bacterium]